MIKKLIKFEDYNGEEKEKECYFNLSKSELTKLELTTEGGMKKLLETIVENKDVSSMIDLFESLVLKSYGVKVKVPNIETGKDEEIFKKSQFLSDEFKDSPAYDALFMELITDEKAANEFVRGLVPASLQKELDKEENKHLIAPPTVE